MANYGEIYYATFADVDNNPYKLSILELNYTGATQEVRLVTSPVITYPQIQIGYDWVFSSGIEFDLLSVTDRQYIHLFTNELQKFKVIIYKKNSSGVYNIIHWKGFLDTEIYSEELNRKSNYPVRLTGNDGLKLLDNYKYLDSSGNSYSGITDYLTIITNCLTKIDFDTNVKIAMNKSTTIYSTGATYLPSFNICPLSKFYGNNNNYYDEEGEPMSCYDVLTSVLKSFQLYIFQNMNDASDSYLKYSDIYIVDDLMFKMNNTTDKQVIYTKYIALDYVNNNSPLYGYTPAYSVTLNNFDINTDKKIYDSSGNITMQTGINSQKIEYSQYATTSIIKDDIKYESFSNSATTINYSTSSTNYKWQEITFNNCQNWTKINGNTGYTFCHMVGNGVLNSDKEDNYAKISAGNFGYLAYVNKNVVFKYSNPTELTIWDGSKYKLKIEVEAYFRTKTKLGDSTEVSKLIPMFQWMCYVRCGDKLLRYDGTWITKTGSTEAVASTYDMYAMNFIGDSKYTTTVADAWVMNCNKITNDELPLDYNVLIPMPDNYGKFEFGLSDCILGLQEPSVIINQSWILDARVKSVKLSIVDVDGNVINMADLLYEGFEDLRYKSKGNLIKSINGTNINDLPISRGAIMISDGNKYYNIDTINNSRVIFNTVTSLYEYVSNNYDVLEHHNLNNILNHYKVNRITLNLTTKMIQNMCSSITYNSQFYGKRFRIIEIQNDYSRNTSKIKLVEYDNN